MDYTEMLFALQIRDRASQLMQIAAREQNIDVDQFLQTNSANSYIEQAVAEVERIAAVIRKIKPDQST